MRGLLIAGAAFLALAAPAHAHVQAGNTSTETVALPDPSLPLSSATASLTAVIPEEGPSCFVDAYEQWKCTYAFIMDLTVAGLPAVAYAGDDGSAQRVTVVHPRGGEPMNDPAGYATSLPEGDTSRRAYNRTFAPNEVDQERGYLEYQLHVCIGWPTQAGSPACKYWPHHLPVLKRPSACDAAVAEDRLDSQAQRTTTCASEGGASARNAGLSLVGTS